MTRPDSIIGVVRMVNKKLTAISPRVNKEFHKHLRDNCRLTLTELIVQCLNEEDPSYFVYDETSITPQSKRYVLDAILLLDWTINPTDRSNIMHNKALSLGGRGMVNEGAYWGTLYYIISQTQI